jgi:hypothetical protein
LDACGTLDLVELFPISDDPGACLLPLRGIPLACLSLPFRFEGISLQLLNAQQLCSLAPVSSMPDKAEQH